MKKISALLCTLVACAFLTGCKSNTPYIGENGNWWVGDSDLGVPAEGKKGDDGEIGPQGEPGQDGAYPVNIEKILSNGLIDYYRITMSDGKTYTFTVKNGEDGVSIVSIKLVSSKDGVSTYKINFSNGSSFTYKVNDGKKGDDGVSIVSIELISSKDLFDTYRITYSNNTYFDFVIKNGADGKDGDTPYIGENGNWWIGDADTGVLADHTYDDRVATSGLQYVLKTYQGVSGYFVSGFDIDDWEEFEYDYIGDGPDDCIIDVVIPNHIGYTPVIGVCEKAFYNLDYIGSVKFSKNTMYIGESAFEYCYELKEVDFCNCPIKVLSEKCFKDCDLTDIVLPPSVIKLDNYAFSGNYIQSINYENIKYFGARCLDCCLINYLFLSNNVEHLGEEFTFSFVYLEHGFISDDWGYEVPDERMLPICCHKNNEYIYSLVDNKVIIYQYLGNERILNIPSSIDGHPVTYIGYGFASFNFGILEFMDDFSSDDYERNFSILSIFDEVIIPNTVIGIDYYTFVSSPMLIYVPSSVIYSNYTIFANEYLYDLTRCMFHFVAFEDDSLPLIYEDWDYDEPIYDEDELDEVYYEMPIGLGCNKDKIIYSPEDKMFYYDNGSSYATLSYRDFFSDNYSISSSFNGKEINTISKSSFAYLPNLKNVNIGDKVKKIQKYAFIDLNLDSAFIPLSVEIINAYGFDGVCDLFAYEGSRIPDDWDSLWSGYSNQNYYKVIFLSVGIFFNDEFMYSKSFINNVFLLKYIGNDQNIFIPNLIDGLSVTTICSNFYTGMFVFASISSSVNKIEKDAFKTTEVAYSYFAFGCSESQLSLEAGWFKNSYSSYNNNYNTPRISYDNNFENVKKIDDFYYREVSGGVEIVKYNKTITSFELNIPRTINNKNVVSIASLAYFITTNSCVTISIPSTVLNLSSKAFLRYINYSDYINFEGDIISNYNGSYYFIEVQTESYLQSNLHIHGGVDIGY